MYICLLRCEGEFYSPGLPKVPGTQWTPTACLFNKGMKTEKIIRNTQRAISHGEQITKWRGHTQSEDRFAGAADSHSRGREGLLWERVSPSTAPTTSSDPETLARKYMTSPQRLQRTGQLLWGYHTESYQLCLLSSGHSWIPPSWFCYSPCPTCAHDVGCLFY